MGLLWILLAPLLLMLFIFYQWRSNSLPLPPGPFAWPIVGSLFSLRTPLYQFYGDLAKKYGPVLLVKVGTVPVVVVSTPKAAEEVLKIRDSEFANRAPVSFTEYISFNYNDLSCSTGETWKKLRKICNVHLFSNNKINMSASVRALEVGEQVKVIYSDVNKGKAVNLTNRLHELIANTMFILLFGRQHYNSTTERETSFLHSLLVAMEDEFNRVNIGDIFPQLRWLDLQGKARKWQHELMPPLQEFMSKKIEEHRRNKKLLEASAAFEARCFLDVLISLDGKDAIPDIQILGVILDMLAGGISSQGATLDWAFAELLRHPEVMVKAQQEIDNVIGKERLVEESDLPNLPYISAIAKETMRLNTGFPLGSPLSNPQESQIGGYRIPAKSTIFVNLWAISHDPTVWEQPDKFLPERFMTSDIGYIENYNFLPFMAGRRICVGFPLVLRLVPLVIATLLQSFEWGSPPGQSIADIDMSTKLAGIHARSKDLLASATPRLSGHLYAK